MDKTVPAGAAILLHFIREIEVGGKDRASYDVIYAHKQSRLPKPLTAMTIDEVIAAQRGWSKSHGSSAAGGYQFMRATLTDLKKELGLRGSQLLDPDRQDRLAYHLLKRRGYDLFIAGKISRTEFGKRLAMEWASFPVLAATKGAHRQLSRGQSYYAGDGVNKALVVSEVLEAVIDRAKAAGNVPSGKEKAPSRPPTAAPAPQDVAGDDKPVSHSKRFWTWLTTGGGTAALPFVDWRVQFLIVVVVVGFAIYAIATMPVVRKKLGLA